MWIAIVELLKNPAVAVVVGAVLATIGTISVALINRRTEWAASRRERKKARLMSKLQAVCPHVECRLDGPNIVLEALWWKQPGTWIYSCRLCGAHADPRGAERAIELWRNASPEDLTRHLLPHLKAAKKARSRYDAVAGE